MAGHGWQEVIGWQQSAGKINMSGHCEYPHISLQAESDMMSDVLWYSVPPSDSGVPACCLHSHTRKIKCPQQAGVTCLPPSYLCSRQGIDEILLVCQHNHGHPLHLVFLQNFTGFQLLCNGAFKFTMTVSTAGIGQEFVFARLACANNALSVDATCLKQLRQFISGFLQPLSV